MGVVQLELRKLRALPEGRRFTPKSDLNFPHRFHFRSWFLFSFIYSAFHLRFTLILFLLNYFTKNYERYKMMYQQFKMLFGDFWEILENT